MKDEINNSFPLPSIKNYNEKEPINEPPDIGRQKSKRSVFKGDVVSIYPHDINHVIRDIQSQVDDLKSSVSAVNINQLQAAIDNIEGGDRMDESTRMIIERLERDSREREERYHKDAQERERRYREENKEREERITNMIADLKTEIKSDFKNFDNKLDKIETKVDSTYKHISAITIATIVGIGACVVAIIIAMK
ncbi:hypothetical protein ABEX47_13130 [Paenibacillus ehimensis]|uniref:hypothetical protein n=1 Tax=Paenibacillus ehimensis TaxID=79264 RepID=UPI003D28E8B0